MQELSGSAPEGVGGPGGQVLASGGRRPRGLQFPQFDGSGRRGFFQPLPERLDRGQEPFRRGGGARPEFPGGEPGVHHARRFGFGGVPEPVGFVQDDLGALQVGVESAFEPGRPGKPERGMGSFVQLGADPLPRRRDGHRFRAREVVARPLGVHFELADALDSLEAELDADGKLPVHREDIHDAPAAGEVPRPAHRILIAITGRGEPCRDAGGGGIGSLPDVDGRLAETIRPGGAAERAGRGGDDEGRVPGGEARAESAVARSANTSA